MELFTKQENRIRCGKCNTEFDLNKNLEGCPLCGFGKKTTKELTIESKLVVPKAAQNINADVFFQIPPSLSLNSGKIIVDEESKVWGSWLMFNDFFAPKFLCRVLAWKMQKNDSDYIMLNDLMIESINIISKYNLSTLKGFPNLEKDEAGNRLVYHFLRTFVNIGLVNAESVEKETKDIWKEKWNKVKVSLTKDGLKFAQIKNNVFDNGSTEQILTSDEKEWLIEFLKQIDKKGYKEYSTLKELYEFLKAGNNGNQDLWDWFENKEKFRKYIFNRSERARNNDEIFKKQVHNYARSFASAKISLLRELGVIKDKRNDYTIVGDL